VPPGFYGEDVQYTFIPRLYQYFGRRKPMECRCGINFPTIPLWIYYDRKPKLRWPEKTVCPLYGSNSTILNIDMQDDRKTMKDTVANARYDWWQGGLYA
jgi:hypothetical protein